MVTPEQSVGAGVTSQLGWRYCSRCCDARGAKVQGCQGAGGAMAWPTPSDTTACNLPGVYDVLMINIRCMSYKKYHLWCILQVHLHQR